jgi:hypothetical protein
MIGASGAIAGMLSAYLVLNPRGNVVVFVWILLFIRRVSLPAVLLLSLWFFLQLASTLSVSPSRPGVALWAHVGVFVAGTLLVVLLRGRGTRLLPHRRRCAFYTSRARDARRRFGRHGAGGPRNRAAGLVKAKVPVSAAQGADAPEQACLLAADVPARGAGHALRSCDPGRSSAGPIEGALVGNA